MICPQCNKEFIKVFQNEKYCSVVCRKLNRKIYLKNYQKKYNQTDIAKEGKKIWRTSIEGKNYQKDYIKKYRKTDKGKEVQRKASKKYGKTEKGKLTLKKSDQKYTASSHGKETRKKYQQTDKFKDIQKIYIQSDRGKSVRKKHEAKYNQSNHGKEIRKKYQQSDHGRAVLSNWFKAKYKSDPKFKMISVVRGRLGDFLRTNNMRKTNKTFVMVGCTPEFLKKHLEKQFHSHPDTHQPMNWHNHTLHGWHIDHKIPLDSAKTPDDVEKLMYYTNLQPMWAEYNIKKGNKY